MKTLCEQSRPKPNAEIRLLRLALTPPQNSYFDNISSVWTPAQPTEDLSLGLASECLDIDVWAMPSAVAKRIQTLRKRFPADQFIEKHSDWAPAAALLGSPRNRLNWFWQSGLITVLPDEPTFEELASRI